MSTVFGRPQRTANAIFVPILKAPRLTISDISYINVRPGASAISTFTMTVRAPWDNWAAEQLEILDTEALAATHVHNNIWFTNALTENDINDLFQPTIDRIDAARRGVQMTFQTSMKNPPKLIMHGEPLSMDLFYKRWTEAPKCSLVAVAIVDVAGIFFEKRRFRLRLVLRSLDAASALNDDLIPDKSEVEDKWDAQIASQLTPAIEDARKRLTDLESAHAALVSQLEGARALTTMGSSWRERLATIERSLQDWHGKYLT